MPPWDCLAPPQLQGGSGTPRPPLIGPTALCQTWLQPQKGLFTPKRPAGPPCTPVPGGSLSHPAPLHLVLSPRETLPPPAPIYGLVQAPLRPPEPTCGAVQAPGRLWGPRPPFTGTTKPRAGPVSPQPQSAGLFAPPRALSQPKANLWGYPGPKWTLSPPDSTFGATQNLTGA